MDEHTCEECGGIYKSKAELDAHMQRDHAVQPTVPTTAGQPTTRKED